MKNRFCLFASSLLLALSCLVSCGNQKQVSNVLLNGFETIDDLYNVRQLMSNISYDVRAKLEINKDANYIKSGEGSLKVEHKTNECSAIFQRIDTTSALDGADISDIATLSVWVYNANEYELPVILNVVGQEQVNLTSHIQNIPAKQWSLVTYSINKVVIKYNYKAIQGFSIGFDRTSPNVCYLDDFSLSFGSKFSQEDEKYIEIVENLNKRMGAIPDSIAVTDTATIEEARQIGLAYQNIPEVYRVACSNYSRYLVSLSSYVQTYSMDYAAESDVTALFFGSIFGLSQVSLGNRTKTFALSYTEDKKYADEIGSLKAEITDNTLDWWAFDASVPFQLTSYKEFHMNVYNDSDHDLSLSVSWDGAHIIKAKQWNLVTVLCADFPDGTTSNLEIEFTGLDEEGISTGFLGNVYFANANLIRNSAQDFADVVNSLLPIEELTYQDKIDVDRAFNYYYDLDINEQSKPLAVETLLILQAAQEQVLSCGKGDLSTRIDALPEQKDFEAYQYSLVDECYEIYMVMSDVEKQALSNRQKLLDLYQYAHDTYGLVYTPSETALNYSTFRGKTDETELVYDQNIGTLLHLTSSDCLYGLAYNFAVGNLDEYSEIRFFVSSKNWSRFGLFSTPWWTNAYDFSRHIIINDLINTEFTIDGDTLYECVISVDDFLGMNYFMFHSLDETGKTLPIDAKITSFYGVKK